MPDYVYALHDFQPEHEDEVPFRAGERIEVIERDDLYGDGWWQGRNLSGRIGLFPQSYTAPAPPAPIPAPPLPVSPPSSTFSKIIATSASLHEEQDKHEAIPPNGAKVHTSQLSQSSDGEVMKATMTDVQKAIEQLGRNDRDGSRSFSFSSTRDGDGTDRETETDLETDRELEGADGGEWHRDARSKLAEQARRVVEAREKEERDDTLPIRALAPPIEVEMSDESEGEEEQEVEEHHQHAMQFTRSHNNIPEEDEDDYRVLENGHLVAGRRAASDETSSAVLPVDDVHVPQRDEEDMLTATAARFPTLITPSEDVATPEEDVAQLSEQDTPPSIFSVASPIIPSPPSPPPEMTLNGTPTILGGPLVDKSPSLVETIHTHIASTSLPSPAASGRQGNSKHSSLAASVKVPSEQMIQESLTPKKPSTSPSEWSVDEVVEWLQSNNFDKDVCDKFIEQEITGDVLLELDVNLLKSEIGILAFGKRVRIARAITDLRRPPSVVYSDHQPTTRSTHSTHSHSQSPSQTQVPTSATFSHGPSQSHTYYSHSHSHSVQSSTNSPLAIPGSAGGSYGFNPLVSPESAPRTGDIAGSPSARERRRGSDPGSSGGISVSVTNVDEAANGNGATSNERVNVVGLGLAVPNATNGKVKNRPTQLQLSPSDGALGSKAIASDISEEIEEERTAMSENETTQTASKQRRRMFGRSTDSAPSVKGDKRDSTTSRTSKDVISPVSDSGHRAAPTSSHTRKRRSAEDGSVGLKHSKSKRSVDVVKGGAERLSLFGGSLASTIGKSRKPPPRYSALVDGVDTTERPSALSLSRLYASGRKVSGRPSTSDGIPKEKAFKEMKEKDVEKEPALLRKRTTSAVGSPLPRGMMLKPGQSILEQIGTPDHNGWLRKKGERYNTWKLRYLVLKGQHLYYLRSNAKTETKIKGYINILGYKVVADENVYPGRYGFRIVHDVDRAHYFSSEEQIVVREWMKAIMKATIGRDYSKPVVSSCNIPTIPLTVAQAMNPAPRPPSPTQRAATQKALRRENPNQLSSRDARILMGLPSSESGVLADSKDDERPRLNSFFSSETISGQDDASSLDVPKIAPPPRPSREMRGQNTVQSDLVATVDDSLIEWANSHLPSTLQITDPTGPLCNGLQLLRIAEYIKGRPSSPPVPDSAFPSDINDDKLDGLFRLFDFLLDNDVKMGTVSINDVRQGKREKVIHLIKALKAWEDKRKAIANSIGKSSVQAGAFTPASWGNV